MTPLPPLLELTSYGLGLEDGPGKAGARLLPHQMRLHQLGRGGAAAPEDNILPSVLAKQWHAHDGAVQSLARLPVLPVDAVRWGIVQSATQYNPEMASAGEGHPSDRDAILHDMLTCQDGDAEVHLLAQGTAPLGKVCLPLGSRLIAYGLSPTLNHLEGLTTQSSSGEADERQVFHARVPLRDERGGDSEVQRRLRLLSHSTTLHHLFSYLLDTLHLIKQVFNNTYKAGAVEEWRKHVDELERKYICTFEYECTTAIAGGRLGDGLEVLLMTEFNESVSIPTLSW